MADMFALVSKLLRPFARRDAQETVDRLTRDERVKGLAVVALATSASDAEAEELLTEALVLVREGRIGLPPDAPRRRA